MSDSSTWTPGARGGFRSATTAGWKPSPATNDHTCGGCGACATCAGLASPMRPRFFAGQLLTDVDLTALERYVIDKGKLHNRYLHGWGVACGLEVACGDCGDDLVVRPGYALGPCGDDIIVPSPQRLDIAKAIRECLLAERTRPICDPPVHNPPSRCDDEARWCVTLRYREVDVRPVTPLVSSPHRAPSCGGASCDHGSDAHSATAGYSCTCGAGGSRNVATCGGSSPPSPAPVPPGCEPTRTVECFELGVCRDDDNCHDLADRLAGTMPVRIVECLRTVSKLFVRRVSSTNQGIGMRLALDATTTPDREQMFAAVCQLHDAVVELYERDPLKTRCTYPKELTSLVITERGGDESAEAYVARMRLVVQQLLVLVVAYARDCVCDALLPPCPPDPCDDRIILACVTVKDGKVTDICNMACRRYAGSFVSRQYWFPIGPALAWAAGILCCFPIVAQGSRRGVDLAKLLRAFDADGSVRRTLAAQNFALVGDLRRRAREGVRRLRDPLPGTFLGRILGTDRVNLAVQVGRSPTAVRSQLAKRQIDVTIVHLDEPRDLPITGVGVLALAEPGTSVVAFVHDSRVIGFGRADP